MAGHAVVIAMSNERAEDGVLRTRSGHRKTEEEREEERLRAETLAGKLRARSLIQRLVTPVSLSHTHTNTHTRLCVSSF